MNIKIHSLLPIFAIVFFIAGIGNAETFSPPADSHSASSYLNWTVQQGLLPQAVARPFFGVIEKTTISTPQRFFFVIGGSYFENSDQLPGTKRYSDQICIVTLNDTSTNNPSEKSTNSVRCKVHSSRLPVPCAEGVTLNYNGGLLLCGGVTDQGESNAVWFMDYNPQTDEITFTPVENLPVPCLMFCGGVIADKSGSVPEEIAYVYSGSKLFALENGHWTAVNQLPSIPSDEQSNICRTQPCSAVRVSNGDKTAMFVFGGYDNSPQGHKQPLFDVWKMIPSRINGRLSAQWIKLPNLEYEGKSFCTIGATAIPLGAQSILLVGGFNAEVWKQTNESLENPRLDKDAFLRQYYARPPESFNWNKNMFVYHTVIEQGIVFEQKNNVQLPAPVCGAAVAYIDKQLVIVAGEVKPGLRTDSAQILNLNQPRQFGLVNWLIFIGYLSVMLPFGYFFMRKNKNTTDYFKGGGKIPWWVTGVAIFAAMLSSITFMTVPAMTFSSNWCLYPMTISIFFLVPIVIWFYLPFFRRLQITSAYEYLEKRFNVFSRVFASAAFIVFMIVRSAIVVYLPALALSVIIGMNLYVSILLVGTVTVLYSAMGGVSAVIWSEFIQAIVLVSGALIALVLLINGTQNGLTGIWDTAVANNKFHVFDFSFSWTEPVFWITFIGGFATNLSSYTSDQTIVQKYMTTKDEKAAARSIWFNGLLSIICSTLFYFIGTCLYSYYKSNAGNFDWSLYQNDAVFPTYIVSQMPTGISGILIAAIFAAAMSTLSANFNSAATAFISDFYRRFLCNDEQKAFRMAKISALIFGIISIGFALLIATLDIKSLFMEFQKVIGILTGGLAGLFVMGIFIPRINGIGAVAGLSASYIVNIILIYSQLIPCKPHFLLYAVAGLMACIVVGYIVSLFTGSPRADQIQGLTLQYRKE